MKKVANLMKLKESGVIAVVRGASKEEALQASKAIVATFKENPAVVVGAGTVLDAVTARLAIMAGAEYVVSPTFDQETAELCNLYQIPYLPGCMTISEMKDALKAGADIIKLFPGSAYGPSIISAFKAPLPQLNIMPTGGVSLDNMQEWFAAGVVAVGVGGNLLAPAASGDFDKVTEVAKQYAAKLKEIRGK